MRDMVQHGPFPVDDDIISYITRDRRVGEVCMVLQRPDGRVWCAAKTFYIDHTARLLTGGVHPGEDIRDALYREVAEETGLAILTDTLAFGVTYQSTVPFTTWVFHCRVSDITPVAHDPTERIHHFEALQPHDLLARAQRLASLPPAHGADVGGTWRAWGEFRAHTHRLVAEYLLNGG